MWLEFFYKFGATHDVDNFIGAGVIYTLYLLVLLTVFRRFLTGRYKVMLFTAGFIGLMAEWFLIGNAPWSNPNALQIPMFAFHAVYPVCAMAIMDAGFSAKGSKRVILGFLLYGLFCAGGFLIPNADLRFAWFIWLPLLPYMIMFFLLLRIKSLHSEGI